MKRFDVANYVDVNERIQAFWAKYPEGRIVTRVDSVDHPETKNRMGVVIAEVYRDASDQRPFVTGIAKEREGTMGANLTAFLENAETSAIGRALANAGFMVDKARASKQEMEAVNRSNEAHQEALVRIKDLAKEGSEELKDKVRAQWAELKADRLAALAFLNEIEPA